MWYVIYRYGWSNFQMQGTKVTISSADIPYIKESVLHLYSLGIHEVNINCVLSLSGNKEMRLFLRNSLYNWPMLL